METKTNTNILRVRNLAQKLLWDEELSGQISDGMATLAGNPDLTLEGLMSEANVSRSIAARAIRESASKAAV